MTEVYLLVYTQFPLSRILTVQNGKTISMKTISGQDWVNWEEQNLKYETLDRYRDIPNTWLVYPATKLMKVLYEV